MTTSQLPQSKKSALRPLIIVLVLLVAGATVTTLAWKRNQAPPLTFKELKVERGDLEISVNATGTVQPENRLEIKPPIPGRVETVLVKEGSFVKKGQILAWMSSTERAALLDAARAKGEEELKRWEGLYRPTPVIAPINGMIIRRNVEAGQTFASNDAILVMSNRLTVKAQVDETDIAKIKLRQPATLVLDAYPQEKIQGQVDQIAFEAKTVNNVTTYIVDVLPGQTPSFMRSGMTANVTFQLESRKNVLLIPNDAIRIEQGRTYILQKRSSSNSIEKVDIEVGLSDGRRTEILTGLNERDPILIAEVRAPQRKDSKGSSPFSPSMGRPGSRGSPH